MDEVCAFVLACLTKYVMIYDVGFTEVAPSRKQMAPESLEWEMDLFYPATSCKVRSHQNMPNFLYDLLTHADMLDMVVCMEEVITKSVPVQVIFSGLQFKGRFNELEKVAERVPNSDEEVGEEVERKIHMFSQCRGMYYVTVGHLPITNSTLAFSDCTTCPCPISRNISRGGDWKHKNATQGRLHGCRRDKW